MEIPSAGCWNRTLVRVPALDSLRRDPTGARAAGRGSHRTYPLLKASKLQGSVAPNDSCCMGW